MCALRRISKVALAVLVEFASCPPLLDYFLLEHYQPTFFRKWHKMFRSKLAHLSGRRWSNSQSEHLHHDQANVNVKN